MAPDLLDIKPKLLGAMGAGFLQGADLNNPVYAMSTKSLMKNSFKEQYASASHALVLAGPTPLNAKRVPGSLIVLPIESSWLLEDDVFSKIALGLVKMCSAGLRENETSFEFVGGWRTSGLACELAGETAVAESECVECENILSDRSDSVDRNGFWNALKSTCLTEATRLDKVLNWILLRHTAWYSPYSGALLSSREAFEIFALVQANWQKNEKPVHAFGAQYWNHPSIAATFSGKGGPVEFHEAKEEAISAAEANGGEIVSWAGRTDKGFEVDCEKKNIPLSRIEDGFLRSVGLGAGLARGAMLAVDDLGIYYDPSRPSRLEALLRNEDLTATEVARGRDLVSLIKTARVSKYNFGKSKQFKFPEDRKTILVPGQVADDAAIRKSLSATIDCATTPNVNLDLLKLTRERNPDAFLVFKPHPDVETGLRKGRVPRKVALQYADVIAEDANIVDLIEAVEALETFSSLSGFEALLRDKEVTVHGAPFYAGWGLTKDLTKIEGRGRVRSMPELVYLAIVRYSRTIDPVSLLPCTPEYLISRLSEQRQDRRHLIVTAVKRHSSWLGRKLGI
ncbi:Capsule polysaccharide biosynthesis protein [Labrenzia sp. THAF82]|nr:Capsule polysaccharide biosynthesis protein [Labrenzia sp. THAF82]